MKKLNIIAILIFIVSIIIGILITYSANWLITHPNQTYDNIALAMNYMLISIFLFTLSGVMGTYVIMSKKA